MAEKVTVSAFIVQGLSTLCICYLTSLIGFVFAWPSYTIPNFVTNQTVLSYPMSSLDISLLGSLTNVGALVVTPFSFYAVDTFGRKYSAMLFGLPFVLAWTIISLTNYVPLVLFAVGLSGFGAGGQTVTSVYIAEISQDSIRGLMASTCVSGFFTGLLLSYIFGAYLSYKQVVLIHLALSVLYVVLLTLLHESPVFLVQKGKEKEAAKAIAFYRRVAVDSKEVEMELRKIKLQLDPRIEVLIHNVSDPSELEELMKEKETLPQQLETESAWQFLKKSESSKRALFAVLFVMAIVILMGAIVLQVYAEPLFKEAVPSMSSSLCAIFLAVVFLIASALCGAFVDKCGRTVLMTYTSYGSGICLLLLGSQLQYHWAPHFYTALIIYCYCFVFNLGAATVPFVLAAEVFLPEVRGLCNSITMACMWILNFVTLIIFNPLVDILGLGILFYIFAIICFIGGVYAQFFLPETKGLSADAIQVLFIKKKGDAKTTNSV